MKVCFDTNICIYLLKGTFQPLEVRFRAANPSDIGIPAIVRAELMLGAAKSGAPRKTMKIVERFLAPFTTLSFGAAEADAYASIRGKLEKDGTPIGPNDLLIAATAVRRELALVTHNLKEFRRVPRLRVEDWTVEE